MGFLVPRTIVIASKSSSKWRDITFSIVAGTEVKCKKWGMSPTMRWGIEGAKNLQMRFGLG
jgi:hypothetical protein